jgi:hypothetical protein
LRCFRDVGADDVRSDDWIPHCTSERIPFRFADELAFFFAVGQPKLRTEWLSVEQS